MTAGYSGTPLSKKLGYKSGFLIRIINAPDHYFSLFDYLPEGLSFSEDKTIPKNVIHFFTRDRHEFQRQLSDLKKEILPNGMIWVSWPKKSSKVQTDITEDVIRNHALSMGLVDVKVCAVDDTWSGLKLVIPVKERT
jgi:Protein of unknown function (DUF3052)